MDEDREKTYDPSTAEIDRGRQQGLGMGARDLAGQRDPQSAAAAEDAEEDADTGEAEAGDDKGADDKGAGI